MVMMSPSHLIVLMLDNAPEKTYRHHWKYLQMLKIGDVPRKLAMYTVRSDTRPDAQWLHASNLLKLTIFSQRQYNFQEQSLYQATRKKEMLVTQIEEIY
jgi:hypothetical protein